MITYPESRVRIRTFTVPVPRGTGMEKLRVRMKIEKRVRNTERIGKYFKTQRMGTES